MPVPDPDLNDVVRDGVTRRMEEVEELHRILGVAGAPCNDTPGVGRQKRVMSVARFGLFAAGAVSETGGKPKSEAVIHLLGTPDPAPQIAKGFLHFVDPGALRAPHWHREKKWLSIWLDRASLPLVLAQLERKHRVLWIGCFDGGTVHAELYAHD